MEKKSILNKPDVLKIYLCKNNRQFKIEIADFRKVNNNIEITYSDL